MLRFFETEVPALPRISWALAGIGLLLVLKIKSIIIERRRNPSRLPLPPGPRGLPVLGNFLQMPREEPWIAYDALCRKYGDIVYFNAFGLPILVVGSSDRAVDLLDKRSANFSDRLALPVLELVKRSTWDFSSMPYGPRWRLLRRTFHKYLSPTATAGYHPVMEEEIQRCLLDLRNRPDDFLDRIELLFGAIIMRTSYGFDDIETNKALVKNGQRVAQEVGDAMNPTKFLINVFPSLRYVPEWLPGAGWKRHLRWLAELSEQTHRQPFDDAKANRNNLKYACIASSLIDDLLDEAQPVDSQVEAESLCRDVAAVAYSGGSDTTISSAIALILALANHPEVQKKAAAELDAVVGLDRLPTMADRPTLPYLQAIVKEISRWFTVVPMGAPHASVEDSEYDGYFIPKGTAVMPNAWAIMHDPKVFENPGEFNPERYLREGQIDPSVPDAEQAAFGYGRRICPGRHFSADTLFLFTASLLSTFTIELFKDEAGNPIPLEFKVTSHTVCKPLPFKCKMVPRPCHEYLIKGP